MPFLVLALLGAPAVAADPAKVSGVVLNSQTQEPVRKVSLVLRRDGGQSQSATTDAEGKFTFPRLEPGTYRLNATKVGFLRMEYGARSGRTGGTPLRVETGSDVKVEFKLIPQGVITGIIVDEDGDVLEHAQVSAMRVFASGRRGEDAGQQSNDLGEFRISNLSAGRYYVMARPSNRQYAPAFFPSSPDQDGASIVDVRPGQQASGIQIMVRKSPVFRVRGRVDMVGGANRGTNVFLSPRNRSTGRGWGMGGGAGSARVNSDGTFEIVFVRPGAYNLIAMAMGERGARGMGRTQIDVASDLDNVVVSIAPAVSVSGKVKIEGQDSPAFGNARVTLRPLEGMMFEGAAGSRRSADGTFKIDGATLTRYGISVGGLPAGAYVKSILLANQPVRELDLTTGISPALEVILSMHSASVEGIVKSKDAVSAGAAITLIPEPFDASRGDLIRQTTADQSGKFSLTSLPPGAYRIYAWSEPVSLQDTDPSFLKPFESKAVKLDLKEDGKENVELQVLDPDATLL